MSILPLQLVALLLITQPSTQSENVPWPVKLGARSLHRSNQIPLVDQVVIVPDMDTWIDEMAHWSTKGHWPVLLEDDHLAPMFIRRLKPAQVIQRGPVTPPDKSIMERFQLILAHAWGAQSGETYQAAMTRQGLKPLGLVLTTESSKALPAAIALAVGRGQAIATLDGPLGGGGTILGASKTKALAQEVRERCKETGLTWKALGDELDAITICRNLPARVRADLPATARVNAPNVGPEDPMAITDVLGRRKDGHRYAIVGWINGNEIQSSYAAMCSLFLVPNTAWLCNGYPQDGQWMQYDMATAAHDLTELGYECTLTENATIPMLRLMSSGGLHEDLIMMNSKGNRDFFDLGTTRGTSNDVPVLSSPAILQMIHSWSLQDPSHANTIGGRWLEHGVYAYVGSSHEPFLAAFVPPAEFAKRLAVLVPFLAAGRWWEDQGPFARPWRINTLGDPLMTAGSPSLSTRPRITPSESRDASTRGLNVRSEAERLMRSTAESPSPERLTMTLRALNLLGEDDLARNMWSFGIQNKLMNGKSASIMLGPLFRLQDRQAFLKAWPMVSKPSRLQRDMLWQLIGPSLASSTDDDTLLLLEQEVTGPLPSSYIEVLGPHLSRQFGTARTVRLIQQASAGIKQGTEKKRLDALLAQYASGRID
ncbi:MAG: hypothetical protein VX527_02080 [Planctomycetota bacterium]|nr:hypothetical protein [Planctomycetota bacterium]